MAKHREPNDRTTPFRAQELAERWGVSKQAVIKAIQRGDLPAFRMGAIYLIPPAGVEARERGEWPEA
jgi:excisionase family DNA binding protein